MSVPKPLSVEAVRDAAERGLSAIQAGADLACSDSHVRKFAKRHGIRFAPLTSSFWNDARKQIVRQHVDAKLSAGVCAKKIGHGCTRNMCLSMARRMHLVFVGKVEPSDKAVYARKANIASAKKRREEKAAGIPAAKRPKKPAPRPAEAATFAKTDGLAKFRVTPFKVIQLAAPHPVVDPEPIGGGIKMLALKEHHCRWPFGAPGADDFGFCGLDKERGSYCGYHASKAYSPLPPKAPKTGNALARQLRRYAA